MFGEELGIRIKQLEAELKLEQERYINSVKSHRDYNTLRSIRENIRDIKLELEQLYSQRDIFFFSSLIRKSGAVCRAGKCRKGYFPEI